MIAAPLFGWCNAAFGYRITLLGLAATLAMSGIVAGGLTAYAGSTLPRRGGADAADFGKPQVAIQVRLFAIFFLAAAAGLTILSQAVGIVAAYGGATTMALAATTGITAAIASARLGGGWLVDRFPVPFVAACAHGLALTGAALLTLFPSSEVATWRSA